jgi:hypothetical protein
MAMEKIFTKTGQDPKAVFVAFGETSTRCRASASNQLSIASGRNRP